MTRVFGGAVLKPPLELAARALCRFNGLPEDTKFEGRPMWEALSQR
jgi:hypothetical protein